MAKHAEKWFISDDYLNSWYNIKLAGDSTYTYARLLDDFKRWTTSTDRLYNHFLKYGNKPDANASPNKFFDVEYYIKSKVVHDNADKYQSVDQVDKNGLDYAKVEAAFAKKGISAWDHYCKYGTKELINPSEHFDTKAYIVAKLTAEGDTDVTDDDIAAFAAKLAKHKWSALSHAEKFAGSSTTTKAGEATVWTDDNHKTVLDDYVAHDKGATSDGKTFALTVNEDNFTGTAADDTFNAFVVDDKDTLQSVDNLDGGKGTDTLNATLNEIGQQQKPILSNIENLNLRFAKADDVSLASSTGIEKVNIANSSDAATISGLKTVSNVTVENHNYDVDLKGFTGTTFNLTLDTFGKNYAAKAVNVDSATLNTLNVTSNEGFANITGLTKVTTLNANVTGSNTLNLPNSSDSLATVTVAGSGSLNLGDTNYAKVKTVTSTAEGGITIKAVGVLENINASAGNNTVTSNGGDLSATFGSGNDSLTLTTALTTKAKIDLSSGNDKLTLAAKSGDGITVNGGDGTDTLVIKDASWLTKGYSNFEVLGLHDAAAGTYDLATLSGLTSVAVDSALAGDVVIKGYTSSSNISYESSTAANDLDASAHVLTLGDPTGTVTSVTMNLTALDKGTLNATEVALGVVKANVDTGAKVQTLTLTSDVENAGAKLTGKDYVNELALKGAALTSIKVDGDASLNLTSAAANLAKVDASSSNGNITFDASTSTKALTYIGSKGVDTFTANDKGDIISGGLSADTMNLATSGSGNDVLVYNLKNPAESQISDTSKDGKITLAADKDTIDTVKKFNTVGEDKIELDHSDSYNAYQKGALLVKTNVTDATDLTSITDFFADQNGDRAVAFASVGGNGFVFVDADADGNFVAANDMLINLSGVAAIDLNDISFS